MGERLSEMSAPLTPTAAMRTLLLLALFVGGAFAAGWFQIDREGDSTTIQIDRGEIRSDARRAIDRGRDFLDRRDAQFADDRGYERSDDPYAEQPYAEQPYVDRGYESDRYAPATDDRYRDPATDRYATPRYDPRYEAPAGSDRF